MRKKPKIHFMSKEDCDREEASRRRYGEVNPEKWYFGKILCGNDNAVGCSPDWTLVTCKGCLAIQRDCTPRER